MMPYQLSTLRRIIQRKSSVKNFKSSANPASPFPNKPTVGNDPYPFPNVRYPCQCSEQHQSMRTNKFGNLWSSISFQSKGLFGMMYQLSTVPKRHVVPLKGLRAKQCNGPDIVKAIRYCLMDVGAAAQNQSHSWSTGGGASWGVVGASATGND